MLTGIGGETMADAAYYRAYYAAHKDARARSRRKYMTSPKGFAYLEKMRKKYINDEEYRKLCLKRSVDQRERKKLQSVV